MSTDNMLMPARMQQGWPGATGSGTAAEAAGGDPAEFLQALWQRMQTAAPATGASESAGSGEAAAVPLETLAERLQALIASWAEGPAVAREVPEADGRNEAAGGKSLPDEAPSGPPWTSAAEQWLQGLLQGTVAPPPAATPQDGLGAAGTPSETAAAPANRAVGELVQMLRAAGLPVADALAAQPDQVAADSGGIISPAVAGQVDLAGSEAAVDTAAQDGFPAPAAAPAESAIPRHAGPVAGDARNLSGLERLMNRSGADSEPLEAVAAQLPAAVREQAEVAADSEGPELEEPVPVQGGITADAMAETRPAAAASEKLQAELRAPLQHPRWPLELAQRVNWLAGLKDGIHSAEIKLNPDHLGPLEVRVSLNQDQASIQFVSHHAAVREAIESAVPKLREMLGEQNLNLVDVNVSQQSFSGDQRQPATAQFDFGRNSQGGGDLSPGGFAPDAESVPAADTVSQVRAEGGSLSLYA